VGLMFVSLGVRRSQCRENQPSSDIGTSMPL
jgi:hypothetical protein